MKLYLVRHGQSTTNRLTAGWREGPDPGGLVFSSGTGGESYRGRQIDPELTDLGWRQAELTAERLRSEPFAALYCSPLLRAMQTARVLGAALNLSPCAWVCLTEHRGLEGFRGLDRPTAESLFPECLLPEEMGPEGWWDGRMEDEAALRARAGRAVEALLERHGDRDGNVAVVAHGTFSSHFLSRLLECPPTPYCRFLLHNCSVSIVEAAAGRVRLLCSNDVSHLPADLRT